MGNVLDLNNQTELNALSPAAQSTEQDTMVNFGSSIRKKAQDSASSRHASASKKERNRVYSTVVTNG